MKIKGEYGEYEVKWRSWGWTYAVPIVHKQKRFIFKYWGAVWRGPSRPFVVAEKMHPIEMRAWFMSAVQEYEAYIKAWEHDK